MVLYALPMRNESDKEEDKEVITLTKESLVDVD
jgi:hypothetical protein